MMRERARARGSALINLKQCACVCGCLAVWLWMLIALLFLTIHCGRLFDCVQRGMWSITSSDAAKETSPRVRDGSRRNLRLTELCGKSCRRTRRYSQYSGTIMRSSFKRNVHLRFPENIRMLTRTGHSLTFALTEPVQSMVITRATRHRSRRSTWKFPSAT